MDRFKRLTLLVGVAALSACASQPFDYHSQQEIPRGPGALTGEDGALVLRAKQLPYANDERRAYERFNRSDRDTEEQREFREWREWRQWRRQNAK